ncbi:hypothetical protein ACI65C_013316 [Semiaphis heraclei]
MNLLPNNKIEDAIQTDSHRNVSKKKVKHSKNIELKIDDEKMTNTKQWLNKTVPFPLTINENTKVVFSLDPGHDEQVINHNSKTLPQKYFVINIPAECSTTDAIKNSDQYYSNRNNIDTVDLEIIEEDLSCETGMGNVNSNNDNSLNHKVNNNGSIIDTVDVEIIEEDLSYEIGMGNVNSNNDNSLNHKVNNNGNIIDTVDVEIIEEDLSYEIGMGNVNSDNYDSIILNNEVNNNDNINIIIDTVADVEMIEENLDFETEIGNDKNYNDLQIGTSAYKKKLKGNKRKINSELRIKGKDYKTRKGTLVKKKSVLPNPCISKKCQNACGFISEENRQDVFDSYYQLDSQQRKDFLVSATKTEKIKRRYSASTIVKKSCSNSYFLPIEDFMDYKQLQIAMFPKLTNTDDGQKIKVNEIKIVSFFKKSSTITLQFSYDLDSEKKQVTIKQPKQRRGSKGNNYKTLELQPAFNNKLPISVAKYNDLLKLCNSGVIPNRYHKEYKSLKRNENVDDVLGETDEEDNNIILETDPIEY